jgi:hypothetical protein
LPDRSPSHPFIYDAIHDAIRYAASRVDVWSC